jgi:hypothetical protein
MADATLTRLRLAQGIWEGLLDTSRSAPPRLRIRHRDELLGDADTLRDETHKAPGNRWLVRFRLPADRLSDGVQTFVVEDADTGAALASETLIAGDALDADIRAEVDLLRAELDMLKRAFRRHCSET